MHLPRRCCRQCSRHLNSVKAVLASMCRRVLPVALPFTPSCPSCCGGAQGSARIFTALYAAFLHERGHSHPELQAFSEAHPPTLYLTIAAESSGSKFVSHCLLCSLPLLLLVVVRRV